MTHLCYNEPNENIGDGEKYETDKTNKSKSTQGRAVAK
ncbi:hypothetical protein [uncultured Mediterranean phage uvMED]|nr:hypothetical protein [uncultured Mediterranean phage uvMED]